MTLWFYRGNPREAQRQYEEIAARTFARHLRLCFDQAFGTVVFNVRFRPDYQADALLLTERAVTVIDWKDTLGPITGGEAGPWRRNGTPIKAGVFDNPYLQMVNLRKGVSGFLQDQARRLLDEHGQRFNKRDFQQVGAAIVFTPTEVEHTITLDSAINSWLLITGLNVAAPLLTARNSQLRLRPHEITALVERGWKAQRWDEIDQLLPEKVVGVMWHLQPNGERAAWLLHLSCTLGKAGDCVIPGARVSRRHAQLHIAGGDVYIWDLESTNGTFVNEAPLLPMQPHKLNERDIVTLGGPSAQSEIGRLQFTRHTAGASGPLTMTQRTLAATVRD